MTLPPSSPAHRAVDALPAPESRRRQWFIRGVALFACTATTAYLVWRACFTLVDSVLSVALLLLEVHTAIGLALFTFSLWDVDAMTPTAPVDSTPLRLALLIPTYDEPEEVLLSTVAAAVAIEPAHETWVLDDGGRPEVATLAATLGAKYLTRSDRAGAKAGNLNNALAHIDADLIGIVDADHVVAQDFFRHTLGYFADPLLAVVQTPQCFYNDDSFEHEESSKRSFSEQSVFYRVILPGKNRWQAAFWCGTGAVVRVEALRSIGGVATETVTEDMHTSIRLHRAGWKIVAHNEVLAHGLAASDAQQYWLQRHRWSAGAMQVLRIEKPMTSPGLTVPQRLAYAATIFAWFDSWRTLAYLLLPLGVLATGATPVATDVRVFGPLFLFVLAMQMTALRLLTRGHYPPAESLIFEELRMPAVVTAPLQLFRRKQLTFRVTPKGRTGDVRGRARPASLHLWLLRLVSLAVVWMGLTFTGLTPLHYGNPGAVVASASFLLLNTVLVAVAASRVRSPRFAGERRGSVRFVTPLEGLFNERPCRLLDVSMTGARIELLEPAASPARIASAHPALELPTVGITLRCHIRRLLSPLDATILTVQFDRGQTPALAVLVRTVFHGLGTGATVGAASVLPEKSRSGATANSSLAR